MYKLSLIIIGIVALVVVFFAFNQYIYEEEQPDVNANYFQQQLTERGVADIGQPIEGFNANLLMAAFPGFKLRDFDMVQTLEGHYELKEDGVLEFVRDQSQPISSAERAISDTGYQTLLQNVAQRLGVPADTDESVDALIDEIDTAESFAVALNETGTMYGVSLTPLEVLEDSRCPADVECIQAGTVRINTQFESDLGETELEIELNDPITTETEKIALLSVTPVPHSENTIEDSDYRVTFRITKR